MVVGPEDAGLRLDQYLALRWPAAVSRSGAQRAVADGRVRLNGAAATRPAARVAAGDQVRPLGIQWIDSGVFLFHFSFFLRIRFCFGSQAAAWLDGFC